MPATGDNCAAIIPCRDEAATIGGIVRGVRTFVPTVVVIDDGSGDRTEAEAKAAGATVLKHPKAEGKGAALATGWAAAAALGMDWVLQLDGDGQHAADDATRLMAAADGVRLVVGNRLGQPSHMPWLRRLTNRWMSRRLSRLAGVPLPDSQCGFRLAHLPTLGALGLRTRHFEIESEMCVAFARAGHRIAFVPVQVRYAGERSKISPVNDAWRWWRWYRSAKLRPE